MRTHPIKAVDDPRCETWGCARELLMSIADRHCQILYRGHADVSWKLTSSLGRIVNSLSRQNRWKPRQKKQKEQAIEQSLLEEFKKAHRRLPGAMPLPADTDDLLALAQHHSLPTRLLDWSRSPYIAAFFAFDGCRATVFPPGHDVVIWALDWSMMEWLDYYAYKRAAVPSAPAKRPDDWQDTINAMKANGNLPRVELLEDKGSANRRVVYQEGLFTRVMEAKDNIVSYIKRREQYAPGTVLTKIVIPGTEQAKVLRDLQLMAITPVTLMNDFDGAAATAFNAAVRFQSMTSPRPQIAAQAPVPVP